MVRAISQVAIQLHPADSVAVARTTLTAELDVDCAGVRVRMREQVPAGHKFALRPIASGAAVRKFGQIIGFAQQAIEPGCHVHTHNLSADDFTRDYAFCSELPPPLPPADERFFCGYDRGPQRPEHQRYGTRNYVAIISTVNCSAAACRAIADRIQTCGLLGDFPQVDGILPIVHKQGCGMAQDGLDHQQLNRTLAGFARHANVAACLLVGLGCETGQAMHLIEQHGLMDLRPRAESAAHRQSPQVLVIQECGGLSATVEAGVRVAAELLPAANDLRRCRISARHLILGTQCGGSDGASGITANPALGVAADLLVQQGGTVILGETPEIYGAEHLLTRRAISRQVGEKLVERIRWWEWYTRTFGVAINNNPSVGNKAGGLTTIYEKSLGAIAKAGRTALMDVVLYAEPVTTRGLVVMDTPGYDPVSMTGIVAGGANVCAFTTGRGSVYGCKPAPCLKIATNTPLFQRMPDDMDLDAGTILSDRTVDQVGHEIFEAILAMASGEKTKSERQGLGEDEFAPWHIGPTL